RQAGELDRMEQKLRSSSQEHRARQAELDSYARHLRKEVARCRDLEREMEAEQVKARVEMLEERKQLRQERADMQSRMAGAESTAARLADALEIERAALEQEREQLAGERAYLDQQRQELVRLRQAGDGAGHDTRLDSRPDRMDSARQLLRELAEKRKR
ncbi:MAG: hypothetical protein K2W96_03935, partial [Gemmataceae bacterium]|nr:hypothetical protein [Gemmataceae bacterium]